MNGIEARISEVTVTLSPDDGDRVSLDRLVSALQALPALLAVQDPIDPSRWEISGRSVREGDGRLSFLVRPMDDPYRQAAADLMFPKTMVEELMLQETNDETSIEEMVSVERSALAEVYELAVVTGSDREGWTEEDVRLVDWCLETVKTALSQKPIPTAGEPEERDTS